MEQYINRSGRSGIESYQFVDGGVDVKFKNGGTYHYPIDGNDNGVMAQMHALLDHGEWANRLINQYNPKFTKGPSEKPPLGDNRPVHKGKAKTITERFMARVKPISEKFTALKTKAMQTATNFGNWVKARIK